MGSAKDCHELCEVRRGTEFKKELRKGNYAVRTSAMKTNWVVALWIGWEVQNEGIQTRLNCPCFDQRHGQ